MDPKESSIVGYYDNNPDYTLRWPPELFAQEAGLLVRRGTELGTDTDWQHEVSVLLQQAFVSPVPVEDFGKVIKAHAHDLARSRQASQAQQAARLPASANDDEPF